MNILKIADGVTGLFPKKILVTVVDEVSGLVVGSYKADKEGLPEVFDRPMTIELNGVVWRVVKAEWLGGKRLNLTVQEEGYFRSHNKRWMVPTVAPKPKLGGVRMANDLVLEIGWEEWRQVEFLPAGMEEIVGEEIRFIEGVARYGNLLGYETVHMRPDMLKPTLAIPFGNFYELVNGKETESISLKGSETVHGGFLIRSESYVYYGMTENSLIQRLGIQSFEAIDDEITRVLEEWNLMMVDWCSFNITISNFLNENGD